MPTQLRVVGAGAGAGGGADAAQGLGPRAQMQAVVRLDGDASDAESVGELVWARMQSGLWWPAEVLDPHHMPRGRLLPPGAIAGARPPRRSALPRGPAAARCAAAACAPASRAACDSPAFSRAGCRRACSAAGTLINAPLARLRVALGPAEARVSIPRECGPRFDPVRIGPPEAAPTAAEAGAVCGAPMPLAPCLGPPTGEDVGLAAAVIAVGVWHPSAASCMRACPRCPARQPEECCCHHRYRFCMLPVPGRRCRAIGVHKRSLRAYLPPCPHRANISSYA
jgi:hypothetical protein